MKTEDIERAREKLDSLFEFALVLLGVLSATEFQFISSLGLELSKMSYFFNIFTLPLIILILVWFMKKMPFAKERVQRLLGDFCWYFWAWTLLVYLSLYHYLGYYQVNLIQQIVYGAILFLIFSSIILAHFTIDRKKLTKQSQIIRWLLSQLGILSISAMTMITILYSFGLLYL